MDWAPPVGRSFCMAPSSHISPKGELELFKCQRRHFPTTWGTLLVVIREEPLSWALPSAEVKVHMGPASRIPHQGCRNSVTPDILSFSSLRPIRVMPLFGSARSEHGCEMYNGQVTLRSMDVNGAFCTVISPSDPNNDSRPSSSRRRSGFQSLSRPSAWHCGALHWQVMPG